MWVIRIYVFCSILIPLFYCFNISWLSISIGFVAYEFLYYYEIGVSSRFVLSTLYYLIPYGVLAYIGYTYNDLGKRRKVTLLLSSGLIFFSLAVFYRVRDGQFILTQMAKYPPRAYYLSYGVFISLILMMICEKYCHAKLFLWRGFRFISQHSLWIYLWHILGVFLLEYLEIKYKWEIETFFFLLFGLFTAWVQDRFVAYIEKRINMPLLKYL